MGWEWLMLPLVGGIIGWITNFVAIRMLFRPKRPISFGGRVLFQGVIPRRREDLAAVVARTVEKDLLPLDELLGSVDMAAYRADVVQAVVNYVDQRLEEQLPEALPRQVRGMLGAYVRRIVTREADGAVETVFARLTQRIRAEVRVADLVREKMLSWDTDELERVVERVARTELRMIEVLGAVLGGVIGIAQAAALTLWSN